MWIGKMKLTSEEINIALDSYNRAKEDLQCTVIDVQTHCNHDHIAEWNTLSPPLRICLHCGLTEEGWGCGFTVLINKTELGVPSIDREKFLELRQGAFIREENKGPLIRMEITLNELL